MAGVPTGPSARAVAHAVAEAGARMIEDAQRSVVQVRSGRLGAGAGVIWDAGGLVLTNDHVVAGRRPGGNVGVILPDGRSFEAKSRDAPGAWTWRCSACGMFPAT